MLRERQPLHGRTASTLCTCSLAAYLLSATTAGAGEVTHFEIAHADDRYHLTARALIDAPRDEVWRVLTDYARLSRVSPRILKSEVVGGSPPGVTRVRTLNRLCFLFFCRNLRHVQLIREVGYGDFESTSVPAESDLSYGYARWRLSDQGPRTGLSIDFTFAIDTHSWLPAFVGRLVARAVLRSDTVELIKGIERVADTDPASTNEH
ncbi:MAG: SRPBCC family protein [Chromatiaceae bacterium]